MTQTKQENQKKSNSRSIFIILISILCIGIGVLFFMNIQKNEEIEAKNQTITEQATEISAKLTEIEGLRSELISIKEERDRLGLSNDSLNLKIENLNSIIKDYKNKGKAFESKKALYEKQLAELKKERDKLLDEIAIYKSKSEALSQEVEELSTEKSKLSDSLSALKAKDSENEAKIAIASVLKTESFKIEVMDSKGKIREGDEFRSKRIDKLKITFKIADNKVAKQNSKNVYMRLVEPSGAAVFDLSSGGGSFDSKEDGRTISYTAKQSIDFNNSKQEVVFVYTKGSEYLKGTHKVQIYIDGYYSGESSFNVK
ncbi:MAG: hypothetical protein SNJ77_01800 [Cytophagales bacterium]